MGRQLLPPKKGAQQPPTFRPMSVVTKRSPVSATAEHLLDIVTGYVYSGSAVDVVFLDFAKAFDKIPHRRLI